MILFKIDVVSAAAPSFTKAQNSEAKSDKTKQQLISLWKKVLCAGTTYGADVLVLSPWGCGAFNNDAKTVAHALKIAMADCVGYYEKVILALYIDHNSSPDIETAFSGIVPGLPIKHKNNLTFPSRFSSRKDEFLFSWERIRLSIQKQVFHRYTNRAPVDMPFQLGWLWHWNVCHFTVFIRMFEPVKHLLPGKNNPAQLDNILFDCYNLIRENDYGDTEPPTVKEITTRLVDESHDIPLLLVSNFLHTCTKPYDSNRKDLVQHMLCFLFPSLLKGNHLGKMGRISSYFWTMRSVTSIRCSFVRKCGIHTSDMPPNRGTEGFINLTPTDRTQSLNEQFQHYCLDHFVDQERTCLSKNCTRKTTEFVTNIVFPKIIVLTSTAFSQQKTFDPLVFSPTISVPEPVLGHSLVYELKSVGVHQPAHFVAWFREGSNWVYTNDLSDISDPHNFTTHATFPRINNEETVEETVEFLLYEQVKPE